MQNTYAFYRNFSVSLVFSIFVSALLSSSLAQASNGVLSPTDTYLNYRSEISTASSFDDIRSYFPKDWYHGEEGNEEDQSAWFDRFKKNTLSKTEPQVTQETTADKIASLSVVAKKMGQPWVGEIQMSKNNDSWVFEQISWRPD